MFLILKKKTILAIACCVLTLFVLSLAFSGIVQASINRFNGTTIVIDAGHGGLDVKKGQYSF